jgi:hypothetical protein
MPKYFGKVVVKFEIISRQLLGETERNHDITLVRIVDD